MQHRYTPSEILHKWESIGRNAAWPQARRTKGHRSLPHSRIEGKWLDFVNADSSKIWMSRIQYAVVLSRYQGRGNDEYGSPLCLNPLHSSIAQCSGVHPSPIPWQIGRNEPLAG